MKELRKRSLAKAISWRIIATGTTLTISYLLTDSLEKATGIAVGAAVFLMMVYYLHERAWDRVKWGRK